MHRGYVNLWRRTTDSQFFSMGLKHIGLFAYLLLKANWKTGWFMGTEIKPGQFGTSITHLAEALHEHRHTVKKILQDLSDCSMIKRQNMSNRWVLITICNWDSYQNPETYKNPTKIQPDSNRTPTECHENATIKSSKALETGKDNTPLPPKGEGYTQEFEAWWDLYPKKEAKGAAFRAFKKAKKKVTVEKMTSALKGHVYFWDKSHTEKQYIPHPATWLNQERWNDEKELPKQAEVVPVLECSLRHKKSSGYISTITFKNQEEMAAYILANDIVPGDGGIYEHR